MGPCLILDAGDKPYRELFGSRITKYIGADVAAAQGVSIDLWLTPGERVPLQDAAIDTILSTQALEHVYDFQLYIEECKRLLRPGGILILTAPQQWRLHEVPYDYWRFTLHGLEESFRRFDLAVETMMPCGGVYALLGQVLTGHLAERGGVGRGLLHLLNRTALWLDSKTRDYEDPILWMSIARKSSVTGEASGQSQ